MGRTVFVSSTLRDLRRHREGVASALLRAGFHPIDMADFGARPESARRACLKEVEQADLFVGIYAWRYGSVPAGSSISITEQELQEALRLGKPCFCFVVQEDHPWEGERETGDAGEQLRRLKAQIDRDLVRDTFTTPEDLAIRVLASLQQWERQRDELDLQLDWETYLQHRRGVLACTAAKEIALDAEELIADGRRLIPVVGSREPFLRKLAENPRVTLLGTAGAGKTTTLNIIERDLLTGVPSPARPLPLRLELARFLHQPAGASDGLLMLISDTLYRERGAKKPPSLEEVRSLLESGPPMLLLLDGLDQLSESLRHEGRRAVVDLTNRYDRHSYVLTSRPHKFEPLDHWPIFGLSPLDEEQVRRVLRLATNMDVAEELLDSVLDTRSTLLRLPLYLGFAIELRNQRARLRRATGSVSGLLHAYVEELLHRDVVGGSVGEERLRSALGQLAERLSGWGASLPRRQARRILQEAPLRLDDGITDGMISELCLRGILTEEGDSVRFWHQTLQEYFFAASFVARWRGDRDRIPKRLPRKLRKMLRDASLEPALAFAIAHLTANETETALRATARVNLRLATLWTDDLTLEGREPEAYRQFLKVISSFMRRARLYSKLTTPTGRAILTLFFEAALLALMLGVLFLFEGMSREIKQMGIYLLISSTIFFAIFIDFLRGPRRFALEDLFTLIPNLRNHELQQSLRTFAARLERSWTASRNLQVAALIANGLENPEGVELFRVLKASPSKSRMLQLFARIQCPHVVPLLRHLISYHNWLSIPALRALVLRATRFPVERGSITELIDQTRPKFATIEMRAEASLLRLSTRSRLLEPTFLRGAHIATLKLLIAMTLLEFYGCVLLASEWWLASVGRAVNYCATVIIWAFLVLFFCSDKSAEIPLAGFRFRLLSPQTCLIALFLISLDLWFVLENTGHPEWATPSIWLLALLYTLLATALRKQAFPVDWDKLEKELKATATGTNRDSCCHEADSGHA